MVPHDCNEISLTRQPGMALQGSCAFANGVCTLCKVVEPRGGDVHSEAERALIARLGKIPEALITGIDY